MKFRLEDLLASPCPNLCHALVVAGTVRNGQLEVPDAIAKPLVAGCTEAPPPIAVEPPAWFAARLRTEAEKAPLRRLCAACEYHTGGACRSSSCCGGQVPVEVRLNLTSTHCPRGRWPAH
jgi:hypothetical protein